MKEFNLDDVVPEDLGFNIRGQTYVCPGDIDVDTTLTIVSLVNRLARAEGLVEGVEGNPQQQRRLSKQLEAELLKLFQVHQPDLTELPFGSALPTVLGAILKNLGFGTEAEGNGEDPRKPSGRKKTSTRRRSSSTSARS